MKRAGVPESEMHFGECRGVPCTCDHCPDPRNNARAGGSPEVTDGTTTGDGTMSMTNTDRNPSLDLFSVLLAAENDLAGIPDEMHVRATRDALASVRTALDIVRGGVLCTPWCTEKHVHLKELD